MAAPILTRSEREAIATYASEGAKAVVLVGVVAIWVILISAWVAT